MNNDKMKFQITIEVADKLKDNKIHTKFWEALKNGFIKRYNEYETCFNGVQGFMNYHNNSVSFNDANKDYHVGFCYEIIQFNIVLINHVDIEVEDYE